MQNVSDNELESLHTELEDLNQKILKAEKKLEELCKKKDESDVVKEESIPLPPIAAKWTPSTLCKRNDLLWQKFLTDILNHSKWTREEKNQKIDEALKWCKMIHDYTMSGEMKYKKK